MLHFYCGLRHICQDNRYNDEGDPHGCRFFFIFISSYFYSSHFLFFIYVYDFPLLTAREPPSCGASGVLPGGSGGRYEAYEVRTLQTIAGP